MRFITSAASTLTAVVALMLAGCGGSPTTQPLTQSGAASPFIHRPFEDARTDGFLATDGGIVRSRSATRPSFMDRRALKKPLVFVSYYDYQTVDVYTQAGKNKQVGAITVPWSVDLATDTARNLYSANFSYPSTSSVTVYALPYTNGPKLTLTVRNAETGLPIAVSGKGTVAVFGCTIPSGSQCGSGFLFYPAGSTTPCTTVLVDLSSFLYVFGAAFDHKGNLYFDSYGSGTEKPLVVGRIKGGCNAKKAQTLTTANAIEAAAGIKINKAGRIAIMVVEAGSNTFTIDAYNPPKKGSLGNPVTITPLPGYPSDYSGYLAFQASGRNVWASEEVVSPSNFAGASEFAYPAGGTAKRAVIGPPSSTTYTYGVAVTPALVP